MICYSVLDDKDRETVDEARNIIVDYVLAAERCFYCVSRPDVRVTWKLLVERVVQFFLVNRVLEKAKGTFDARGLAETTRDDDRMWWYLRSSKIMLTPIQMHGARLTYLFGVSEEEETRVQGILNAHSGETWYGRARYIFDHFVKTVTDRSISSRTLESVAAHLCETFASLQRKNIEFVGENLCGNVALEKIVNVLKNRFVDSVPPTLEPFSVDCELPSLF